MPQSKKKKPGNGMSERFEIIFYISELGLVFLLWLLNVFMQATAEELLAVYFVGQLVVIVVLRAINRKAADHAMDILSKSSGP